MVFTVLISRVQQSLEGGKTPLNENPVFVFTMSSEMCVNLLQTLKKGPLFGYFLVTIINPHVFIFTQ